MAGALLTVWPSAAASAGTTATILGSEALAKAAAWVGMGGASAGSAALPGGLVAMAAVGAAQVLGSAVLRRHQDAAKQIGKISAATSDAEGDLAELEASTLHLQRVLNAAEKLADDIERETAACEAEYEQAKRQLEQRSWFGRLLEWLREKVAALMHREHCDRALGPLLERARSLHGMVTRRLTPAA
jgi:hypothetical protein